MDLLLLWIAVLGAVVAILILKACLPYRKKREEDVISDQANAEPVPVNAGNVIPFPQKKSPSRVEGISDELWERWVEISAMNHSKQRADLLLELMYDTVRHINQEDKD